MSATSFDGLLARELVARRFALLRIVLVGVAAAGLGLGAASFQSRFLDGLSRANPTFAGGLWALPSFAAVVGAHALVEISRKLCARESSLLQGRISDWVFDVAVKPPVDPRRPPSPGGAQALLVHDIPAIGLVLEDILSNLVTAVVPLVLAPMALVLVTDASVGTVALTVVAAFAGSMALGLRHARFFARFKALASERAEHTAQLLAELRQLRLVGLERAIERRVYAARKSETSNRAEMVVNGTLLNAFAQVAPWFLNLVGALAVLARADGRPTPGAVYAVFWIFGVFLARPMRSLPFVVVATFDVATSYRRLRDFGRSTRGGGRPRSPLPARGRNVAPSLRLRGLALRAAEREVFAGLDLDVPSGALVVIGGDAGSGKSALARCLAGESDCNYAEYSVAFGEERSDDPATVRGAIGYLGQRDFHFEGTVLENVVLEPQSETTVAMRTRALRALALASFPGADRVEVLDRKVATGGADLSGGMKQRLSLARLAYFDAPIVILDDATSALDVDTRARVTDRLLCGAFAKKTRIVITQDPGLIARADCRVRIRDGHVVVDRDPARRQAC